MSIKEGDKIPSVKVRVVRNGETEEVSTEELFGGKTVALFGVPGAFTPTCSAKHLPGFVSNSDALKGKGVDEIVCASVNDPFVMDAWADSASAKGKVTMLADGNGELAKAMGLEMDGSGFGLGTRNKRYSAIIEDGVVKKLNEEEGGQFEKSSAEQLLEQL